MDNRRQETSKKVEFPQIMFNNSMGFGPTSNQRLSQEFDNNPFIMRQNTNEKYEDLYHLDLIRRSNELQTNVFNNFPAFGFQPGTSQPFPSFMPNMTAFSIQNQLETPQLNMAAQINQHYQAQVQATPIAQPQLGSVQISNMIKDGMWMVCEIDTLFLKRFYSIPKKIFAPANQKAPQQLESNLTVCEWLKQRFRCHFQPEVQTFIYWKLSNFLSGIVDRIEKSKYHKIEETPNGYQYGPIQSDYDFLDKLCTQCKDADNSETSVRDMAQLLFNIIEKFLNR